MVFAPHCLAYFTQHNALQFHPCCCKGYKLLLSLCCIEFHCVYTPEATVENSMEFPHKTKNATAFSPSNSADGIIPQEP